MIITLDVSIVFVLIEIFAITFASIITTPTSLKIFTRETTTKLVLLEMAIISTTLGMMIGFKVWSLLHDLKHWGNTGKSYITKIVCNIGSAFQFDRFKCLYNIEIHLHIISLIVFLILMSIRCKCKSN